MSSLGNKRTRPEDEEPLSQEIPEKKKAEEGLLRPSAIPAPKPSLGLFRQSKLAAPDVSKTLQQLEEKQKQENPAQGQPIVLKDPALSYQPKKPSSENGPSSLSGSNFNSNGSAPTFGSFGSFSANGDTKTEPDDNSEKPKSSNPFAKVAAKATNGFGFGAKLDKGDDTGSSSNPFKRLAAKNADSTWVKTETEVKSEKSEEKNSVPDATSEDDKKEILTGEEEEKNVLQINAKLFQFDKTNQQYSERGRGILRMNDRGEGIDFGSRLVFRTTGTQRVALNTKLWPAMYVEQVTQKSVRISAQDEKEPSGVGVFLLQTSLADSKELFKAIDSRILQMKQTQKVSEKATEPSS